MAEKLTMRHMRVMRALSEANVALPNRMLPNGHGHASGRQCASPRTLSELDASGMISGSTTDYGWRWSLTDAGRRALEGQKDG